MSKNESLMLGGAVAELREQLDADARFKKVLVGFEPQQVNTYLKTQKEFIVQLQDALSQAGQTHEEYRADAETRLAALSSDHELLKAALEARGAELAKAQSERAEAVREMAGLHALREEEAQQLARLRESLEKKNLERMRAQLITATRESSESAANLTAARQENKHLKARLDALGTDYEALSAALAAQRERYQARQLTVERAVARVKAHAHLGVNEAAARLREGADLIAACFAENDVLLSQLEVSPEGDTVCFPAPVSVATA